MKPLTFYVFLFLLISVFRTVGAFAAEDARGELVIEVEKSVFVTDQDVAQARNEAVKGALQEAVERATGTLLAPVTVAEITKILRENLFLKADQYVQNYRIVGEHVYPGIYALVLRVTVALESIRHELRVIGLEKELQHKVTPAPVAVAIIGIKSYQDYSRFKELVKAGIKGVNAVRPRSIAWGTASWEVEFRGEAVVLAAELSRLKEFPIKANMLADNSVEVIFIK